MSSAGDKKAAAPAKKAAATSAGAKGKVKVAVKGKAKGTGKANAAAAAEEAEARTRAEHEAARAWLAKLGPKDILAESFFGADQIEKLRAEFRAASPFPHCSVQKFVDGGFLDAMMDEIRTLEYKQKSNDLYEFAQSAEDLKSVTSPVIAKFREVLYSPDVVAALTEITGIPLYSLDHASRPDLFAAVYSEGSRLLCHDDELDGRRIAFIVYLVDSDWDDKDGGHLDLFATDAATGLPAPGIARSLVPQRACFNFFEVSEKSYHQVREVLAAEKLRVSIGGWFHGPPLPRRAPHVEPLPESFAPVAAAESDDAAAAAAAATANDEAAAWVNVKYLVPRTVDQIAEAFEEESQLQLSDFLTKERNAALLAELAKNEATAFPSAAPGKPALSTPPAEGSGLALRGPANFRCLYELQEAAEDADVEAKWPVFTALRRFLRSAAFFRVISLYSQCTLETATSSVRVLRPGCYTLAHDHDAETRAEGLDAVLTIVDAKAARKWPESAGGSLHYVREGENEELLSVFPAPNTLSLVYRGAPEAGEGGVMQFTRYVTSAAPCSLVQARTVFRLAPSDEEDEEDGAFFDGAEGDEGDVIEGDDEEEDGGEVDEE